MRAFLRTWYLTLPDVIMRVGGTFLRVRQGQESPLLRRFAVPHESAVYALGPRHWEAKVLSLSLIGHRRVLDVGCGSGQWLSMLARHNTQVVGVEPEGRLLQLAAQHSKATPQIALARTRAEELPFGDGTFDAVLCYGVLSYTDETKSLREMSRVLKPAGQLVLGLQGAGYYLHHMIEGVRYRNRQAVRYGAEPILTRWAEVVTGRTRHGVTYWTSGRMRRLLRAENIDLVRVIASVDDPSWRRAYLGVRYFFCVEGRKRGQS